MTSSLDRIVRNVSKLAGKVGQLPLKFRTTPPKISTALSGLCSLVSFEYPLPARIIIIPKNAAIGPLLAGLFGCKLNFLKILNTVYCFPVTIDKPHKM